MTPGLGESHLGLSALKLKQDWAKQDEVTTAMELGIVGVTLAQVSMSKCALEILAQIKPNHCFHGNRSQSLNRPVKKRDEHLVGTPCYQVLEAKIPLRGWLGVQFHPKFTQHFIVEPTGSA